MIPTGRKTVAYNDVTVVKDGVMPEPDKLRKHPVFSGLKPMESIHTHLIRSLAREGYRNPCSYAGAGKQARWANLVITPGQRIRQQLLW